MTLMMNKYLLYIINEIINIIGLLRDLLYIYKYKKNIMSYTNNSYNHSRSNVSYLKYSRHEM